jgi:hypothetical protein
MSFENYNHEYRRSINCEPSQINSESNLWTPTADQKAMLGMIYETDQGDRYKYCKNAAVQIEKAHLVQTSAPDAQQKAKVQTLYGADEGENKFDILATTGSGISDGDLVDGYLFINDGGTAMGDLYIIKTHKWTTGDTVMSVEIADAGGLRNAIEATDDVTIWKNQCRDVITKPTTLTGPIIGATQTIIPASYYFWAKVKGVVSLIVNNGDTLVDGEPCGHIDAGTGAGEIGLIATAATDLCLGSVIYASTADEAALINLSIPAM